MDASWQILSQSTSHGTPQGSSKGKWKTIASFEAERIPISVYVSELTGLRLMLAQVKGPLVTGFMTVATEARDTAGERHGGVGFKQDDGLAHTLEHLVLLGSQDFPYKGVIDHLANKSLAQGINAWTEVDHTAYTVTTAGSQGFLSMLPVMLDHLLFPTLTDGTFLTEVHHVNGAGKDAGVVYAEMESRQEHIGYDLCRQKLLDLIYPKGSGYRAVYGGKMENLRALSNETVRAYHQQHYRPDNVAIIITGEVDIHDVLPRLDGIEAKILAKGERPPFIRPWFHHPSSPPSPSSSAAADAAATGTDSSATASSAGPRIERMSFPLEEASVGVVMIGWLGPLWHEFQSNLCLRIMWLYLVDTAISPLYEALVERENPLCCKISFCVQEGIPGSHYVQFEEVDVSHIEEIYVIFMETVDSIVKEGLDMTRLRSIMQREKLRHLSDVEEDPHNTLAGMLVYAFLYGDRDGTSEEAQLKDKIQNSVSRLEALPCGDENREAKEFWIHFMTETLLQPSKTMVVMGTPSPTLARQLVEDEQRRTEEQAGKLSEEELQQLADRLTKASEENERSCPPHLLELFRVPGLKKVPKFPVCTIRNVVTPTGKTMFEVMSTKREGGTMADPKALPSPKFILREPATGQAVTLARALYDKGLGCEEELPFFLQWDHIQTGFVEMSVWLETSSLPDHLRPLLELFLEVIFELPVRQDDGSLWNHDEVVRYLSADTVSFSNALGTGKSNFYAGIWSQAASITLKVEADKYWLAVRWLRNLLYRTEMCPERIRLAAQKLLSDIGTYKRDGMSICSALMRPICFDSFRSNHAATCFVRQHAVLNSVLARCRANSSALLADMEALREALTQPSNLRVHVTCDLTQQPDPVRPFLKDFLPLHQARAALRTSSPSRLLSLCPVLESRHLRTPEALNPTGKGILISSPSIDSGYLVQCAPIDPVDLSYTSPAYPALLVAMEYMTAMECALSRRIRGLGLANGYEMTCSPEQGLLTLTFYKAANLPAAYEEAQQAIRGYASGAVALDDQELEAAKSSVMFEYVERTCTGPAAAQQSFINYFRGTPQTFCSDLMTSIQAVTAQEVLTAIRTHVLRLFDVTRTSMVAACNQSKALSVKFDLVRKHGRPMVESGTIERCFASMEEDSSETGSTSGSEASSPYGFENGEGRSGWFGRHNLGGVEPRFIMVAALFASAACMAMINKRK